MPMLQQTVQAANGAQRLKVSHVRFSKPASGASLFRVDTSTSLSFEQVKALVSHKPLRRKTPK